MVGCDLDVRSWFGREDGVTYVLAKDFKQTSHWKGFSFVSEGALASVGVTDRCRRFHDSISASVILTCTNMSLQVLQPRKQPLAMRTWEGFALRRLHALLGRLLLVLRLSIRLSFRGTLRHHISWFERVGRARSTFCFSSAARPGALTACICRSILERLYAEYSSDSICREWMLESLG